MATACQTHNMEATSSKPGRRSVIHPVCTDNLSVVIDEKDKKRSTVTFHHPAADGVQMDNYTVTLPNTTRIVSEWTSLHAAVMERPCAPLVKKYGGWVIEEEGVVVVACDKEMLR